MVASASRCSPSGWSKCVEAGLDPAPALEHGRAHERGRSPARRARDLREAAQPRARHEAASALRAVRQHAVLEGLRRGEERRVRRKRGRHRDDAALEDDRLPAERIERGGGVAEVAVEPEVIRPRRVERHEHEVRLGRAPPAGAEGERKAERDPRRRRHHLRVVYHGAAPAARERVGYAARSEPRAARTATPCSACSGSGLPSDPAAAGDRGLRGRLRRSLRSPGISC